KKLISKISSIFLFKESEIEKAYKKKYTIVKTKSGKILKIPFVWLKKDVAIDRKVAYNAVRKLLKVYYNLSGENAFKKRYPDLLGYVKEYIRVYPYAVGSTVVGVSNKFGEGLSGLEYVLQRMGILTGKKTCLSGEKDARGRVYLGNDAYLFVSREKGQNVQITIDGNIQYIFEKVVSKYGELWHPKFINAVLMNPQTGEIIAAVSWPFYDYEKDKPGRSSEKLLTSRFITAPYEPGSVMKPFVAAAAINEGLVTKDTVIFCPSTLKIGKYVFRNEFHGKDVKERVWEIIEYSDNVGAIKLAQALGKKKLYDYYRAFGFGRKTGVEIPGESPGKLNDWKKWKDVEFATLAFGHHIMVTTLQLAAAYSALVNGGVYVKPKILKAIVDDKGRILKTFQVSKGRRVISEKTSEIMRRILTMVVEGGTGKPAKLENFYVGGKTGTAIKYNRKTGKYDKSRITATFAGAFPMTNPRYVLVVSVDEPKVPKNMLWATKIAVPIFKELAERILLYERVAPDRKLYKIDETGNFTAVEINRDFLLTNGLQQEKK
ncbi:MAG: penicillin-binding protein 2, partial [Desulfurobacteriaceae bacterium]